jgi:hypothetical protein
MKQLLDGFSEFAVINQTGTAALIDFFTVLRWLPDFMLPAQKRAKYPFAVERKFTSDTGSTRSTVSKKAKLVYVSVSIWRGSKIKRVSVMIKPDISLARCSRLEAIQQAALSMLSSRQCSVSQTSKRKPKRKSTESSAKTAYHLWMMKQTSSISAAAPEKPSDGCPPRPSVPSPGQ